VRFADIKGVGYICSNELSVSNRITVKAIMTATVVQLIDRDKMPTVHSGTFARPITATSSQAKELEFLPTH
jgi:hypothetical protein